MWLLPRVVDGEAPVRPRMKDARHGEPVGAELRGTLPHEPTPLAASLERAPPQVDHTEPERCQRPDVRWDRIVSEVASYDLPQPFPLFRDWPVHSAREFVIPDLLGGPDTLMIGKVLWDEFFNNRDWPVASAVAVVLVAALAVPILLAQKFLERERVA